MSRIINRSLLVDKGERPHPPNVASAPVRRWTEPITLDPPQKPKPDPLPVLNLTGCGECDVSFDCHNGKHSCIRDALAVEPLGHQELSADERKIYSDLMGLLSAHCGETCVSEGARETLGRILREHEELTQQRDYLLNLASDCPRCGPQPYHPKHATLAQQVAAGEAVIFIDGGFADNSRADGKNIEVYHDSYGIQALDLPAPPCKIRVEPQDAP